MVSLSSTSTTIRYLQLALSACLLGVSCKVINQNNSLTSMVSDLSEYYNSLSSFSSSSDESTSSISKWTDIASRESSSTKKSPSLSLLNIDTSYRKSIVAVSSSSFGTLSNSFNYILPNIFTNSQKISGSSTNSNGNGGGVTLNSRSTLRVLSVSSHKLVSDSLSSISKSQMSYLTLLVSSETVSNILWFINMILFVSEFGSTDCSNIDSLLSTYNLTDTEETSLYDFFIGGSSNNEYDSFWGFNVTELENYLDLQSNDTLLSQYLLNSLSDSGTSRNVTIGELQSKLLINLSNNCQFKKASVGLIIVVWVTYVVSSGLVTSSGITFYLNYKKLQNDKSMDIEKSNKNSNRIDEAGDTEVNEDVDRNNVSLISSTETEDLVYFVYEKDWLFPKVLSSIDVKSYKFS